VPHSARLVTASLLPRPLFSRERRPVALRPLGEGSATHRLFPSSRPKRRDPGSFSSPRTLNCGTRNRHTAAPPARVRVQIPRAVHGSASAPSDSLLLHRRRVRVEDKSAARLSDAPHIALCQRSKRENSIEFETRTWLPTEGFESCSRRTSSVTMGHIPRECGSILGDGAGIVAHEYRCAPIEQAKLRPSRTDPSTRESTPHSG
jgi:hypothetical protein